MSLMRAPFLIRRPCFALVKKKTKQQLGSEKEKLRELGGT